MSRASMTCHTSGKNKGNSTYTVDYSLSFLDPMPHWVSCHLFNCLWSISCTDLTTYSFSVLLGLSSAIFSLYILEWPMIWVCLDLRGFLTWTFSSKTNSPGHTRMIGHLTKSSPWSISFIPMASITPNNNIICSNHPSQKSGSRYPSLFPVRWVAKSCPFSIPSNSSLHALQISWLDYFNSKCQCLPHTTFPFIIHKAAKVKF